MLDQVNEEGRMVGKRKEVAIEMLSEEAFRPFGGVIALPENEEGKRRVDMQPNCTRIPHADLWSIFDLDFNGRSAHIGWVRYYRRKLEFHTMESHLEETEGLIPYGGAPSLIACAPRTNPSDKEAVPDPDSVRAFLLDGTKGIVFHRAVWHRHVYPLGEWTDLIAILSEGHGKIRESEAHRGNSETILVDFHKTHGVTLDLVIKGLDHSNDVIGEVVT
jgi:ureidoglycolate lyase